MITQLSPKVLDEVRAKLNEVLKDIDPNLTVDVGRMKYTADQFTVPITFAIKSESGVSKSLEKIFAQHGLLDCTIPSFDGYMVQNYNHKSWKKPWIVSKGGKTYVTTEEFMQLRWGKNAARVPK